MPQTQKKNQKTAVKTNPKTADRPSGSKHASPLKQQAKLNQQRAMKAKKNSTLYKKSRYYKTRRKCFLYGAAGAAACLLLVSSLIFLNFCREKNPSETTDLNHAVTACEPEVVKEDSGTADQTSGQSDTGADSEGTPAPLNTEPVSITLTVVGDCTLGMDSSFAYDTSLNAYFDMYGPEYFFQNVRSIFEADDLTIANLECSFTESTLRGDHTYCFKAPASYTEILTSSSVEAVNMANNHSMDFLTQGYDDTRAALDDAGVVHFGYEETAVMDIKGVKVGLVGTYEIIEGTGIETQLRENIDKVKEDGAQVVIVIFHWGNELDIYPNYNQYYLGHKAVDFGADLVVGGHAHVIQGIEEYRGKNILYGNANFCFGGNVYPHDLDTFIYQQTFTIDPEGTLVSDLVTNIIPCSSSSDPYYNNYQPTPAEGADAERILKKLEERTRDLPTYSY